VHDGLGYAIVLEHRRFDGSVFTSIYYHLTRPGNPLGSRVFEFGQDVLKGELVGYVTDYDKDNFGFDHLHFGIRSGEFQGGFSVLDLRSNQWYYPGYTSLWTNTGTRITELSAEHLATQNEILSEWQAPALFLENYDPGPAETVTLDFNTLPDGTPTDELPFPFEVADIYVSQGVTFRSRVGLGPHFSNSTSPLSFNSIVIVDQIRVGDATFNIIADFDEPVSDVSVDVLTAPGRSVTMSALDENGIVLQTVESPVTVVYPSSFNLSISAEGIHSVVWEAAPDPDVASVAIDNLAFTQLAAGSVVKDIWTTSLYSFADEDGIPQNEDNFPGGGLDDHRLRVGGWGDTYLSLIQFNLDGLPAEASSAVVELYMFSTAGGIPTTMYLDRILEDWDWTIQGTGRDNERLWWADRPSVVRVRSSLPAPSVGQWYQVDITDIYNSWKRGDYPNFGIQLGPESTSNRWNEFYSSDYADDPTLRPRLVVVE
jgi:hypothetical protein